MEFKGRILAERVLAEPHKQRTSYFQRSIRLMVVSISFKGIYPLDDRSINEELFLIVPKKFFHETLEG